MNDTAIAITPIHHPLQARVSVPGSKSLTNRALLVAALADGETRLTHALFSDDSQYFVAALTRLGFSVETAAESSEMRVTGLGGRIPSHQAELFIGNAGTAARFLTALLCLGEGQYRLDGDARMRQRPIGDLCRALRQLGAVVECARFEAHETPPVKVKASGLPGGRAVVAGEVSSQFLSGLLMVSPYAQSAVELVVENELNSKPYVEMTLSVMADFGVKVEHEGTARFSITPQHYRTPGVYAIESDASAASYFFAAPAICGGSVRVEHIRRRSRQGDMAFLEVLSAMGCQVTEGEDWIEVSGPAARLHGVEVDLRHIPDTAQTLAAIAPFADSPTTLGGIASARLKETDRVAAMCAELTRLGVSIVEHPDGLTIQPCHQLRPARIQTYKDHRMAMAFALVGLRQPGIEIANPGCVSKTFPHYFETLGQLYLPDTSLPAAMRSMKPGLTTQPGEQKEEPSR